MIIPGLWQRRAEDGPLRPVVKTALLTPGGVAIERYMLVDLGADRTMLTRQTLDSLGGPVAGSELAVGGIGGLAGAVMVEATLYLYRDDGELAGVGGPFAAFLAPDANDEDLLGRDVLNNFDVVACYRRREVLLLAPPHAAAVTTG